MILMNKLLAIIFAPVIGKLCEMTSDKIRKALHLIVANKISFDSG